MTDQLTGLGLESCRGLEYLRSESKKTQKVWELTEQLTKEKWLVRDRGLRLIGNLTWLTEDLDGFEFGKMCGEIVSSDWVNGKGKMVSGWLGIDWLVRRLRLAVLTIKWDFNYKDWWVHWTCVQKQVRGLSSFQLMAKRWGKTEGLTWKWTLFNDWWEWPCLRCIGDLDLKSMDFGWIEFGMK